MKIVSILIVLLNLMYYEVDADRNSRFIPIPFPLGWTQFENSFCIANNGLYGTCYTRRVCNLIDGQASGRCDGSVGACCIVQRTCGEVAEYNNTYFVNPNYPNINTNSLICTITIIPCEDVCQIRLDFLSLTLAQPDANGYCINDALTIEGGANPMPIICGENSGQHMYVGVNGNQSITLTIRTNAAAVTLNRKWTIRIAQIGCTCPTLAPAGCLMYYTGLTGRVNSFNFGVTANGLGTRELANLNYGVCVEMLPGYCWIQWSAVEFFVTGSAPPNVAQMGSDCMTDFVVIPNTDYNTDRFCGSLFNTIQNGSKPFVLTVVTSADETGDTSNLGFSLNYQQRPCPVNIN